MARKVMIACALTGAAASPEKNPALPVTPRQIADSGIAAARAGARFIPSKDDPKVGDTGSTLTTPAERVRHVVALKPEICSLDLGSMNMGAFVFINSVPHVEE